MKTVTRHFTTFKGDRLVYNIKGFNWELVTPAGQIVGRFARGVKQADIIVSYKKTLARFQEINELMAKAGGLTGLSGRLQ
jgi:hypothetical protein